MKNEAWLLRLRHGTHPEICRDLVEWDYGEYEGLTDTKTQQRQPD